MKKTLVTLLALVFVLGIAGTAFAAPANPFVDVPAKHWAYGAVAKLVKAGIVDGYGDGTFRGDRAMTRYEMAQVVAKAMAKSEKADAETKALIDKLAVEFAAELNNLGVRVAKLEKNASNIKLSGDVRLRYVHTDKGKDNPTFAQRFRLVAQADVNDTTSFYARWHVLNHNTMGTYVYAKTNALTDANITIKNLLSNVTARAGRNSVKLDMVGVVADTTGGMDGLELTWKEGKSALTFGYADAKLLADANYGAPANKYWAAVENVYYLQFKHKFDSAVDMSAFYLHNQDRGDDLNKLVDVLGVGVSWKFDKNWMFVSDYWRNSADQAKVLNGGSSPKGFVARLQYGAANPAVPGSWQFHLGYLKTDPGANSAYWNAAMVGEVENVKAWDVQYTTVMAKNLTFDAIYQFGAKFASTGGDRFVNTESGQAGSSYTRLQFNFMF
jgi:hypothetical protein